MNARILISIAVLGLVQLSAAHIVRRDVPAAAVTPSPADAIIGTLTELFSKAVEEVGKLEGRFLEIAGVQNRDELGNVVQNKTKDFASRIGGLVNELQAEGTKQAGQFDEIVKSATVRFQETLKKLEEQNPEVANAAKTYKETVGARFEEIVSETRKLTDTLAQNNVEISERATKVIKDIVQQTTNTSKDLLAQIEKSVQPAPAA